ncbi:hypothetical protein TNCV_4206381 [Trichonephila clavipes]|nr:hypothetical protein TNCV_4206381 [Trichonephila clavipes]
MIEWVPEDQMRMGDKSSDEFLSSQESLPLSQETFQYLWNEYVNANQFHSPMGISSLENPLRSKAPSLMFED